MGQSKGYGFLLSGFFLVIRGEDMAMIRFRNYHHSQGNELALVPNNIPVDWFHVKRLK